MVVECALDFVDHSRLFGDQFACLPEGSDLSIDLLFDPLALLRRQVALTPVPHSGCDALKLESDGVALHLCRVGGKGELDVEGLKEAAGLTPGPPLILKRLESGRNRFGPGGLKAGSTLPQAVDPNPVNLLGKVDQLEVNRKRPEQALRRLEAEPRKDLPKFGAQLRAPRLSSHPLGERPDPLH